MQYRISIPDPCSRQWDEMTPHTDGNYCSSCQKTVKDFAQWSDDKIVSYLLENPGTCGRIRTESTFRIVTLVPERKRQPAIKRWMMVASVPLLMQVAYTQNITQPVENAPTEQRENRDTVPAAPVTSPGPLSPVQLRLVNAAQQSQADIPVAIYREGTQVFSSMSDSNGLVTVTIHLEDPDVMIIDGEPQGKWAAMRNKVAGDGRYVIQVPVRIVETMMLGCIAVEVIKPEPALFRDNDFMTEKILEWELQRMMMR